MSTKTVTMTDHITFSKLFAQRSDTSFAQVLNGCFTTEVLIDAFNRKNKTSLALDQATGFVVVRDSKADLQGRDRSVRDVCLAGCIPADTEQARGVNRVAECRLRRDGPSTGHAAFATAALH
jgi:hypothetical protein